MIVSYPAPHRIGPVDPAQASGGIPGSVVGGAGDPSAVSDSYPTPIFDPVHAHDRTVLRSELPPALQPARAAPAGAEATEGATAQPAPASQRHARERR